ncbi:hypothetical protein F0L68_30340 [Solihabitans fulvus]|uniref:Uncharacterized protein n=1 Tax=Solihabitans fulvus TaxID=1892852 RepID=A0A5B2WR56_9PSEU|nr:hypothetical protein [Solihabitans fulvus]KAA2254483.1 hypothetical protein F0L68_30340 [Solihabitans fulvus]
MRRWGLVVIGAVLVLLGAVWVFQGLGYLAGSFMTGQRLWTAIGSLVVVGGLFLLVRGVRNVRART